MITLLLLFSQVRAGKNSFERIIAMSRGKSKYFLTFCSEFRTGFLREG